MESRKGEQKPSKSVVLPYEKTLGPKAVKIYNKTKRKAQEWQSGLLDGIMAVNEEGLWTHVKIGYSVPRRNGKSEILMMRELWGLMNNERILHTAHRTTTSHSTWEKLCGLMAKTGLVEGEDYKTVKQFGLERIIMLKSEAVINFRTRSSKGGLGEGYDLLIIDEAQEYTTDQETALKYVVTDSRNPQTIFTGTPPTTVSVGTVFTKFRQDTLDGESEDAMWAEWSVDRETDPQDKEAWYQANPSLGTIFTERAIRAEIGPDKLDFNIQRLGLWVKYNQKSAISENEWNSLEVNVKDLELTSKLYIGIKYSKTGTVALALAVKTSTGNIFVEAIDCRTTRGGNEWIIDFLNKVDYEKVVVDGASGQQDLADDMKDYGIKKRPDFPTVKDIINAHTTFEHGLESTMLLHGNQPSMLQSVSNCDKRAIGSSGGWGYKSIKDGVDIALLDSVVLAYWACSKAREKKKQQISY